MFKNIYWRIFDFFSWKLFSSLTHLLSNTFIDFLFCFVWLKLCILNISQLWSKLSDNLFLLYGLSAPPAVSRLFSLMFAYMCLKCRFRTWWIGICLRKLDNLRLYLLALVIMWCFIVMIRSDSWSCRYRKKLPDSKEWSFIFYLFCFVGVFVCLFVSFFKTGFLWVALAVL